MKFQDLNLTLPATTNSIIINEQEVVVKTYLPISDKIDLIQIALQKAQEDGIYNDIKLDAYFHLNIVYLYTDIEFSEEDKEDEMKLYDILQANGVILNVIGAMGEDEYNGLFEYLEVMKQEKLDYSNTAAAVLRSIIQDLPKNAAAAKEIVDSCDPSKYQAVADFATAANGGRNINTQAVPVSTAANKITEFPNKD